jgi:uncharacterized Ntn-hydrolase superfamily protein
MSFKAFLAVIMLALPAHAFGTFSIVAHDPETGDVGIAVQSKFFSVGSVVPWAEAGVGAIATQSYANTTYGPKGLALLRKGLTAQQVLDTLVRGDPDASRRQVGIVDARGNVATWTGENCLEWAGGITGEGYTAQGNILVSRDTVEAMACTFESTKGRPLADRLVAALAAGQDAGGDSRGKQSAALLVVREGGGYAGFNDRYVDLRVDDHREPIRELQRLLEMHHIVNAFGDASFWKERGDLDRATRIMKDAVDKAPEGQERGNALYNLACFYSLSDRADEAIRSLEMAFRLVPEAKAWSLKDPDLDPIREDPRYRALVEGADSAEDASD